VSATGDVPQRRSELQPVEVTPVRLRSVAQRATWIAGTRRALSRAASMGEVGVIDTVVVSLEVRDRAGDRAPRTAGSSGLRRLRQRQRPSCWTELRRLSLVRAGPRHASRCYGRATISGMRELRPRSRGACRLKYLITVVRQRRNVAGQSCEFFRTTAVAHVPLSSVWKPLVCANCVRTRPSSSVV